MDESLTGRHVSSPLLQVSCLLTSLFKRNYNLLKETARMLSEVFQLMADNKNRPGETDESGFGENYISLTDEDGVETEFKIVDSIDLDEGSYVALEPTPDDPVAYLNSDGALVILKVIEEDGEEILVTIDDDDEYDEIADIFMGRLSDLYDFDTNDDSE